MQTEIVKISEKNQKEVIAKAAGIIREGNLIVFPTETVYGLGANVFDEEALRKIFIAKGRPSDNPIIVHISDESQLKDLAENIGSVEQKLMYAFWPGPLTIIFKKKKNISGLVSGGLSTIAIRMLSHPIARQLIKVSGVPIAAPSANISGRPSSATADDAYGDLLGKVDMIIDDGNSQIGVESTVVKVEKDSLLILRPGAVTKEMLERIIRPLPVIFAKDKSKLNSSPGTKYKHYAPLGKLEIVSTSSEEIGKKMSVRAEVLQKEGKTVGIISTNQNKKLFMKYEPNVFILGDRSNLEEISKSLYSGLRFFDTHHVDIIVCESFPEQGLGVAIMDRLKRAADIKN